MKMTDKKLEEVLLEKLSSIERNLHLIAFSMYLQTKPNEVQYWEDEQEDKRYLIEGKNILNLDDLWDKVNLRRK